MTEEAGETTSDAGINALVVTAIVVGLAVGGLAFFFGALANLGICWDGCTGPRGVLPWLVILVPLGYACGAYAYIRGLQAKAAADPQGEPVLTVGGAVGMGFVALILATLAFVVTCFGALAIAG